MGSGIFTAVVWKPSVEGKGGYFKVIVNEVGANQNDGRLSALRELLFYCPAVTCENSAITPSVWVQVPGSFLFSTNLVTVVSCSSNQALITFPFGLAQPNSQWRLSRIAPIIKSLQKWKRTQHMTNSAPLLFWLSIRSNRNLPDSAKVP